MKVKGFVLVALAYPAAAACGAAIVALEFAAFALIGDRSSGLHEIAAGWWVLPVAWIYAFLAFVVGLVVIGTPVWLAMAGLKLDRRRDAVVAGAILASLAGFVIMQLFSGSMWSWGPLAYAAALGLPGAVAGWILHRVAYGSAPA